MRFISRITESLNYAGNFLIIALMLLVTVDVVMRLALNKTLLGAFELSEFMLGAVIWFGFAYTFKVKGHIRMDMVVTRFSPRVQFVLEILALLLALAFFVLILWQSILAALVVHRINEVSTILRLPIGLVRMIVPLGAFVVCLEIIGLLKRNLTGEARKETGPAN